MRQRSLSETHTLTTFHKDRICKRTRARLPSTLTIRSQAAHDADLDDGVTIAVIDKAWVGVVFGDIVEGLHAGNTIKRLLIQVCEMIGCVTVEAHMKAEDAGSRDDGMEFFNEWDGNCGTLQVVYRLQVCPDGGSYVVCVVGEVGGEGQGRRWCLD